MKHNTLHIPPGSSQVIELEGKEVAVFNVEERLYAIANRCPHRGGPLSRGYIESIPGAGKDPGAPAVRCPLHGWLFDLQSGRCLNQPDACTQAYSVIRRDEEFSFKPV